MNGMDKAYARYSKGLILFVAVFVGVVASFIFIVNPMGLFNPPVIAGFNDVHPAGQSFSRLQKIEAIKRLKPDMVITGTSRADSGMNIRPELLRDQTLVPYNAGLSAATIREQRAMLEFAHGVKPLKMAVITLDYFAFNGRKADNKQFEPQRLISPALHPVKSFFDTYGTIVALDTLVASIKHLRYIKKPERYAFTKDNGHKESRDVEFDIARHGAANRFTKDPAAAETSIDNFAFAYSDKVGDDTFAQYRAMLEFTRANNIETYLLISPIHIYGLEHEAADPVTSARVKEWKAALVQINAEVAKAHDSTAYPLWDFAYPNSLTKEIVPAEGDLTTRMQWFADGGHYRAALGDVILRKVLLGSKEHPDFGRRLDR